jgi:hypothetical protein
MSTGNTFCYKPLPDAEARIRSAQWLVMSLTKMLRESPDRVIDEHQKDILRHAVCKVTEAETGKARSKDGSGKHGTRYCSEAVWRDRNNLKGSVQHEHVVPNRNIVHALLKPDVAMIEGIIEKAIGCVVYEYEHPREVGDITDLGGWERYKAKGIRVVDVARTKDAECPVFVPETL